MTPEAEWIAWLRVSPRARDGLRAFCPQYYYFSVRQVIAFVGMFRQVSLFDRESLSMLADVLHEELGRGRLARVHSMLFERFAAAVGLAPDALRLSEEQAHAGIRAYVAELTRAFHAGSLPEALAAYQFLESSAVETYGPLLDALQELGFDREAVEFFALHAQVEIEHARAADEMFGRQGLDAAGLQKAAEQTTRMHRLWSHFWTDIRDASLALDDSGERHD